MSRLGVWQCKKLVFRVCNWSGSSRGARAFQERFLPEFRAANPQLEISEELRRGRHPYVEARYNNGNVRSVDLKNKSEAEILRIAYLLRSAAGKRTSKPLLRHVLPRISAAQGHSVQASPSVQGRWTPQTFAASPIDT